MLFNSYLFIFAFLPVTVLGYYILGALKYQRLALVWLCACSIFFYGWWRPQNILIIIISLIFNFAMGQIIARSRSSAMRRRGIFALTVGVAANLSVIAWYKYAGFFVDNSNALLGTDWSLGIIILPLAISFFTFQQIAYLVDCHKGIADEHNFLSYTLFVCFFPQLIAGPIVHHSEMLPQFKQEGVFKIGADRFAIGLSIFVIGLFKKVVLADGVALYANPVFEAAEGQYALTFLEAWGGAFAYTLQLYFDFSGYSDMAIGLGRMFGIVLPLNFYSPYKATSIVEFWRRWHMTLSRFLRDYLYIPLGGNRRGRVRRYANLLTTMLLGGLWHGAGWTFVIWGGLHGIYLVINHAWSTLKPYGTPKNAVLRLGDRAASWAVTYTAVVFAWVTFRALTLEGAMSVYRGMIGLNGFTMPEFARQPGWVAAYEALGITGQPLAYFTTGWEFFDILLLSFIALALPNTYQLMHNFDPALQHKRELQIQGAGFLSWRPSVPWGFAISTIAVAAILFARREVEFLYFQF